jgi:osmoprotectant transport system permease protein
MPTWFSWVFQPFAPENGPIIYERASLLSLSLSHLGLVALASIAATLVAVSLAILVTRPSGAAFLPLSRTITNMGQTFPPVAVLALAVPALGFGTGPTLVALFLYGLLPIFENAITGFSTLPPATMEAARGLGLSRWQRLIRVEIPLALPVILTGVRLSVVIALGTATIGSTVAAKTLGEVIIAGLLTNNTAYVLQGGLIVGLFAVLIYDALVQLEALLLAKYSISND